MKYVSSSAHAATLVATILLAIGCSESPDVANRTSADRDAATADAQRRTADNGDLSRYDTAPQTASDKDKDRVVSTKNGSLVTPSGMGSNTNANTVANATDTNMVDNSGKNNMDRNGAGMPRRGIDSNSGDTSVSTTSGAQTIDSGKNKMDRNSGPVTRTGMDSQTSAASVATASDEHAVDNSGKNKADRAGSSMTPMDQGSSELDIGITRSIRKALTADDRLSTNARNLKVITSNGVVVLRGPVASQAEAELVRGHVRSVTGITRTEDQIAVP